MLKLDVKRMRVCVETLYERSFFDTRMRGRGCGRTDDVFEWAKHGLTRRSDSVPDLWFFQVSTATGVCASVSSSVIEWLLLRLDDHSRRQSKAKNPCVHSFCVSGLSIISSFQSTTSFSESSPSSSTNGYFFFQTTLASTITCPVWSMFNRPSGRPTKFIMDLLRGSFSWLDLVWNKRNNAHFSFGLITSLLVQHLHHHHHRFDINALILFDSSFEQTNANLPFEIVCVPKPVCALFLKVID